MDKSRLETTFFIGLLAIVMVLAWLVFQPYLAVLVLAAALLIVFRPVYHGLRRFLKNASFSAIITTVLAALIVFVPLGFLTVAVFSEASTLYASLTAKGGFSLSPSVIDFLHTRFPDLTISVINGNINTFVSQTLSWFIQNIGPLFSQASQIFFIVFLSLMGLFFTLKDDESLKKYIIDVVPLSSEHTEKIIAETKNVMVSVIRGALIVAILQGIMAGLGFLIFGVPNPAFWGMIVVVASLIPIVGTWLIIIPAIIYLFATGHVFGAFGFLIWSGVIVNVIYNIVSPQLMRRGTGIHPYIILLGVLGGIAFFGPIGFLLGPFIVALLFSLLNMYPSLVGKTTSKKQRS